MSAPLHGVGHNGGPALDPGVSYRRFVWNKARKSLMGESLPIEVIRMRVRRAEELGLPYKSYASIRASTGRDVVGFLFSSNALRLVRLGDRMNPAFADKLAEVKAACIVAAHHPLVPELIEELDAVDRAGRAPRPYAPWEQQRAALAELLGPKFPRDGLVLVSEAPFEAEWVEAGKLAGRIDAPVFFGG
ncbi:hypothetical protein [Celeribacter ethanolicus]|uniref:hypothetical protein n=1 Tax=Celeribacter ethanolicus TaxID=1758178 RepID=UPI000832A65D|nr:hypothetical protein [Celeribacter ethanolicus]